MSRLRSMMDVLLAGAASSERAVHEELQAYYTSVQTTHDDDSLDLAAAALLNTLKLNLKFSSEVMSLLHCQSAKFTVSSLIHLPRLRSHI